MKRGERNRIMALFIQHEKIVGNDKKYSSQDFEQVHLIYKYGSRPWDRNLRGNTCLKIKKDITDRDGYLKYKSSTLNPCPAWSLGSAKARYINLHNVSLIRTSMVQMVCSFT
jgi:hypothetical protein